MNDPASARRSGMTRYHLEVFSPGTNAEERRGLRRFRQWRLWGALAAIVGEFTIGSASHNWQVPLYLAIAYLAGLFIGLQLTKRVRRSIHALYVATTLAGGSRFVEGDLELLESCLTELDALDRDRRDQAISPVEYEAGWARLHARIAA